MPEAIVYCDCCGTMVRPSDMKTGTALVSQKGAVCSACAESLSPENRAAFMKSSRRTKTPRPDDRGHATSTARRTPVPKGVLRRNQVLITGVGVAVGILMGVAVVALMTGSDDRDQPARLVPPTVAVPAVLPPQAPPVPARSQPPKDEPAVAAVPEERAAEVNPSTDMDRIRELVTPGLERYAEITSALTQYLAAHPEGPESAEVKALLEQVRRDFKAVADAELDNTVAAAQKLAAEGRYATARSILGSLRPRFGDTDWYVEVGASRIEVVGREIEAQKQRINEAAAAAMAGATPLFLVGFDGDPTGSPPRSAPAEAGCVSTHPTHVAESPTDTLTVVESFGPHASRSVKFVCGSTASGAPSLDFRTARPITSGTIVVSWESSIREYTYKTNVDTSLTFWMLDARGEPSFGVTYVQDGFVAGIANIRISHAE